MIRKKPARPNPFGTASKKTTYVGSPKCFELELACQQLNAAFPESLGCYLVGSALETQHWRDIDVRMMFTDEDFEALFPGTVKTLAWEFHPKWLILTSSISAWLERRTDLPVDFQMQPQTHANERHKGKRNALGLRIDFSAGEE